MQIPQSNIANMLKAISNGNHVFNETVVVYRNTESDCPDCNYDPVRKESTDPYCSTCDGKGKLITEVKYQIPASVETEEDFKYDFSKAGKFVKGQIYLTIDSQELLIINADKRFNLDDYNQLRDFTETIDYMLWKGARYSIQNFEPGLLQGNLYEIGFTLSLME